MRFRVYIYGRTSRIDFREICSTPNGIRPDTLSLIQQLLNTDVRSNGDIHGLRYLFVREENQVIFGIGFNHRHFLSDDYHTDLSRRRGLRSFIGIVIDNSQFDNLSSIPINSDFFIDLYMDQIKPIWDLEDRPKNRKLIISEEIEVDSSETWCKLDGNMSFNNTYGVCRFFKQDQEELILRSLKQCQSSIMIGLNVEGHVKTSLHRFNTFIPNALCLDSLKMYDCTLIHEAPRRRFNQYSRVEHDVIEERATQHNDNNAFDVPSILADLKPSSSTHRSVPEESNLLDIDWGQDSINESSSISDSMQEQNKELINCLIDEIPDVKSEMDLDTGSASKKVLRPKFLFVVIMVLIVLLVLLLVGKCHTNTVTNPCQSTSGDTTKVETMNQ